MSRRSRQRTRRVAPPWSMRGNPFLLALWAIGPALTVFGLWAQWQMATMYSGFNYTDPAARRTS